MSDKQPIFDLEWDRRKAAMNLNKHGVSFEEAATVFGDPRQLSIYDLAHSRNEDRWVTMGLSSHGRLLVVCHTFREGSEGRAAIRIFSCRKATKTETRGYTRLR